MINLPRSILKTVHFIDIVIYVTIFLINLDVDVGG